MNSLVISGYYGFDNMGDESVLAGMIQALRSQDCNLEVTVLSQNPPLTADRYNVMAINRYHPGKILKTIASTDLFISGGGSLLQDVTGFKSIPYYLGLVYLAQLLGKKTVFYGQGLGPVSGNLNKKLITWIAARTDLITVRDKASLHLLQDWGVRGKFLQQYADPAFALAPEISSDVTEQRGSGTLGISIRNWGDNSYLIPLTRAVNHLLEETELEKVILFPLHYEQDYPLSVKFADRLQVPVYIAGKGHSPRKYIQSFSGLEFFIGTRLHSLIFAAMNFVPFLGLSYDPKVKAFVRSVLPGFSLSLSDITDSILQHKLTVAWQKRDQSHHQLREKVPVLVDKALTNARVVFNLIAG